MAAVYYNHFDYEQERIINSKGYIKYDSLGRGLINGRLAMTRSIGDLDLKPYGVIAMPDTRTFQVRLASMGLAQHVTVTLYYPVDQARA